jgi:hypothetical protein
MGVEGELQMFNFRDPKFVPGFRVREPVKDVPGFRVAPDGSTRQTSADVDTSTDRGLAPESWLQPWPPFKSESANNLAFLGGGLAGMAGGLTPQAIQDVEPVAAGDLKCQGTCSLGGDRGMTGAYRQGGDVLCAKCLVKRLGYGDVPSSELPRLLEPWSLNRK